MTYDFYFHNDFDGRAAAAVMLAFLRTRGDEVQEFHPLDFEITSRWPTMRFPRPAAVFDFLYHPRAAFWFDHHPTTFLRKSWERAFVPTKSHQLDPSARSCCSQVLRALERDFSFRPPRHLRELARWLDIIDGAAYRSPQESIDLQNPAIQIMAYIDFFARRKKPLARLIRFLSQHSLAEVARLPELRKFLPRAQKWKREGIQYFKRNLQIVGRVAVINLAEREMPLDLRFFPYQLYPSLLAVLLRKGKGGKKLSLGFNPWKKTSWKNLNAAEIMRSYGGGGHPGAGGALAKNEQDAERIGREIVQLLNEQFTAPHRA